MHHACAEKVALLFIAHTSFQWARGSHLQYAFLKWRHEWRGFCLVIMCVDATGRPIFKGLREAMQCCIIRLAGWVPENKKSTSQRWRLPLSKRKHACTSAFVMKVNTRYW